jgi:hypothetical protein
MKKVIEAKAENDFSLILKFNDESVKRFDMKPYLDYEVFKPLKNLEYFKRIRIAFGTVQWSDEQDISPETLYLEGKETGETNFYESSNRNEIEQLGR